MTNMLELKQKLKTKICLELEMLVLLFKDSVHIVTLLYLAINPSYN